MINFRSMGPIDSVWVVSIRNPRDGEGTGDGGVIGGGYRHLSLGEPLAFRLAIPEPATLSLLGLGYLALIRRR